MDYKSKFKKVEYREIEYAEFDEIVSDYLGHEFEIVAVQELSNGDSYTFEIDENWSWNEWNEKDLASAKQGFLAYSTGLICHGMHREGLLEPGNYLVHVSW